MKTNKLFLALAVAVLGNMPKNVRKIAESLKKT